MNYTYEDWLKFIEAFEYTPKDIASITGTTRQNVSQQLKPDKPLPPFARGMLHVWNETLLAEKEINDKALISIKEKHDLQIDRLKSQIDKLKLKNIHKPIHEKIADIFHDLTGNDVKNTKP